MMGRKRLDEVRAELEAALTHDDALRSRRGEIAESLRRFLDRAPAPGEEAALRDVGGEGATGPEPRRGRRGRVGRS